MAGHGARVKRAHDPISVSVHFAVPDSTPHRYTQTGRSPRRARRHGARSLLRSEEALVTVAAHGRRPSPSMTDHDGSRTMCCEDDPPARQQSPHARRSNPTPCLHQAQQSGPEVWRRAYKTSLYETDRVYGPCNIQARLRSKPLAVLSATEDSRIGLIHPTVNLALRCSGAQRASLRGTRRRPQTFNNASSPASPFPRAT